MSERVDLFDNTYSNFSEQVLAAIREETFGRDIGQNSWLTADEYDRFISWLRLEPNGHVLEVASGSGGPARYLAQQANCYVTGIDANESGVETATQSNSSDRITFKVADAVALRGQHLRWRNMYRLDEPFPGSRERLSGMAEDSAAWPSRSVYRSGGYYRASDER